MSQSPRNIDPPGPDPSGGGAPGSVFSEAVKPVDASTGSATQKPYQMEDPTAVNRYLYGPEQSSSSYDPYAAGGSRPNAGRTRTVTVLRAGWGGDTAHGHPPLVNFVTVLVMALSSSFSRAKQNFARAILLVIGISLGLMLLVGLMFGAMFFTSRR